MLVVPCATPWRFVKWGEINILRSLGYSVCTDQGRVCVGRVDSSECDMRGPKRVSNLKLFHY